MTKKLSVGTAEQLSGDTPARSTPWAGCTRTVGEWNGTGWRPPGGISKPRTRGMPTHRRVSTVCVEGFGGPGYFHRRPRRAPRQAGPPESVGQVPGVRGQTPGLPPAGRPAAPLAVRLSCSNGSLRSRRRGSYARRCDPPRGWSTGPSPPARRARCVPSSSIMPSVLRGCVRALPRAPHVGQGVRPPEPVQMPFEARGRRQVHRGPRVPVQS